MDPPNVKSKERMDYLLVPTSYPSGWATYILGLQVRKLRLKEVKDFAPSFVTAALSTRHTH